MLLFEDCYIPIAYGWALCITKIRSSHNILLISIEIVTFVRVHDFWGLAS